MSKDFTLEQVYLSTLDFYKDQPVDWTQAGLCYASDGSTHKTLRYHFGYKFDSAISSSDGVYVFIYEKLGTKGVLLKNGELLREINRSYYHADAYEYPVTFFPWKGEWYLIHCPREYCRIDIEHVETGVFLSEHADRAPKDFFHSRLELSADAKYLLSKGWYWHPWDMIQVFDIEACIENPLLLDDGVAPMSISAEVKSACFIGGSELFLATASEEGQSPDEPIPPGSCCIWDFKKDSFRQIFVPKQPVGFLLPLSQNHVWDVFGYPKVLSLQSMSVVKEWSHVPGSQQNSSICHYLKNEPLFALDKDRTRLAVCVDKKLHVIHFEGNE